MPSIDLGTALSHGLSIYTDGGSAVSAYGPIIGRDVAVIALTAPAFDSVQTVFVVTGAAVGDPVLVAGPSSISSDLVFNAWVSSAGNVTLQFANSTLTAIVQTAQTWGVGCLRRSFVTSIR